jgi:hypothetical protein
VTVYELDDSGSIPASASFALLHSVQTDSKTHPASYPAGTGGSFPGVKEPGRETDYSPPSIAEVKNTWIYIGVLISLWLFLFSIFLFAAQPKEFFLDELQKLEQRSHKCVELRGEYVE